MTQYLKVEILCKLIYKFNATIIKIPTKFWYREINKTMWKIRLRNKEPIKHNQDDSEEQQKGMRSCPVGNQYSLMNYGN